FVGRLAPEKGLRTLIDAWPAVRTAHPGARLTLIGEGPERPALEVQARSLGLTLGPDQAVEIPGAVADVTAALRDADLFVLPSKEEGMSIALLEAMALGIPLVASSIPGNRRLVSDFKHGRLAPPEDPQALARVIVEQWENFDRAFHMSRAARSRVMQEFSITAVARKHLALFEKILEQRGV
ncbi:MAG: glycosyltransferase, partial [Isosphaeraceae bacterium]